MVKYLNYYVKEAFVIYLLFDIYMTACIRNVLAFILY